MRLSCGNVLIEVLARSVLRVIIQTPEYFSSDLIVASLRTAPARGAPTPLLILISSLEEYPHVNFHASY